MVHDNLSTYMELMDKKAGYKYICLFGAGDAADKYWYQFVIDRGFKVDFFCDNDTEKWNKTIINNIMCISPEELLKYGKDVLRNICLLPWKKYQNIVNRHLPVPLLKSTMQEVWEIEYVNLDRTSSNKFRAITDVNQYLFRYWDIMRGNFVPRKCRGKAYHIGMEETGDVINDILNGKNNMICINDTPNIKDFERIRDEIENAFLTRYPDKCQYEL